GPVMVVLSAKDEERLKEQAERLLQAISARGLTQADLSSIAYTLQVGREAFAVRLACVVRTIEELTSQLERYCHGQLNMANFYLGEVKRNKNALPAFAADEEMQEAIAKWIQRGKWHKLAELWVQGLAFDWTSL